MLSNSEYKYTYLDEYRYLTNICLNVTDDCNLQCRYCFVKQHPNYMTLDVAKDAVNFLHSNLIKKRELHYCSDQEKCNICFFGGEPTLMWDSIIVPIVEYIKNNFPNDFILGITTNGTLLNDERINFLKQNDIGILLSIDGGPSAQNINRPCKNHNLNSYDLVEKNIPKILENFPNTTFRATISQESVNTVFESYLYAEKLGFKRMFQIPNEREKWTEENIEILKKEIQKIYYYHLQCFLKGVIPTVRYDLLIRSFEYIKWIDQKLLNNLEFTYNNKTCDRCGLGTNFGSIAYDGTIYGCQEQDSRGQDNIFNLGNIYTGGIDIERQKKLLELYSTSGKVTCANPDLCNKCKLKLRCFDDCCPSTSYDMYHNFHTKGEINCIFYQTLIDNSLTLMEILTPRNNQAFKAFLTSIYNLYDQKGVAINGV